ncbi:hypothetical protein PLAN_20101 [Planktothrix rubescens CCAP 1459/22]|uniref:Uncharacterized protein n=1 Tax=Planktothrix rubescens CCAP 1459/22 TaxID=329571 RepID=A0A6J7ZJV3_PLARU|nr:hypothetical protein PLAN_20101 [Planktothrix rubescens NIVA-CYA 18]CAD0223507.1 hypothetical protein PL10110_220005 [Planktothrix agardhii]
MICKGINLIKGFWLVQNMDYSYHNFHSIPKISTLFLKFDNNYLFIIDLYTKFNYVKIFLIIT